MARAPKTLRVTQGTDEANDGTNRYRVAPDGTVVVPADVADRLMAGGGFLEVVSDEPPTTPKGWAKLRHPDGTGCSWGGVEYEADGEGVVTVPLTAIADLAAHGFAETGDAPTTEGPEPARPEATAED